MPESPAAPGSRLYQAAVDRAHAEFALSAAVHDIDLTSEREKDLVEVAISAGVVGALAVVNDEPPPQT